uniref:Uncharacterized protein n=1 Tax=Tetranychus urticae TaxID=32264 RepID=T1KSW1_TETUR
MMGDNVIMKILRTVLSDAMMRPSENARCVAYGRNLQRMMDTNKWSYSMEYRIGADDDDDHQLAQLASTHNNEGKKMKTKPNGKKEQAIKYQHRSMDKWSIMIKEKLLQLTEHISYY